MKNKEINFEEYNKILKILILNQKIKDIFWQNAQLFKISTGWEIYINNKQV
ncbi:hypothetical protein NEIELOOT_01794, partial [Neisseria elongata subsp. glycolytica ATCC 29315]